MIVLLYNVNKCAWQICWWFQRMFIACSTAMTHFSFSQILFSRPQIETLKNIILWNIITILLFEKKIIWDIATQNNTILAHKRFNKSFCNHTHHTETFRSCLKMFSTLNWINTLLIVFKHKNLKETQLKLLNLINTKLKTFKKIFRCFGDGFFSHEFKGRHGVDHKSRGASR